VNGGPLSRVVRFELSSRSILALIGVGVSLWLLIRLWPVVLVLAVALMLVGTMGPLVAWFEHRGVRRALGVAIVFTALFVLTVLTLILTIPTILTQSTTLLEQAPVLRERLATFFARARVSAPLADWLRRLTYEPQGHDVGVAALAITARIGQIVAYTVSAVFLALYIMLDRDRLRGGLFAVVPRVHHVRLSRILMNLESIVGAYIRGQVLTSLMLATFTFVLLTGCGVANALALAVVAGIADVLPYIGVFLSVGPAVLAALARGSVVTMTVLTLMVAYQEFESRVLVPRIYGRVLRLPSAVILVALLAGSTLMGILGALLALPLAAAAFMLIEELRVDLPGEQVREAEVHAEDHRVEEEYRRRTEGVPLEEAAAIAVEIASDQSKSEESTLESHTGLDDRAH
jgi:putative heme transporter